MKAFAASGLVAALFLCGTGVAGAEMPEPASGPPSTAPAAAETVVLPGAANSMGTHGSRWRSDLTIKNPGVEPIEVRLYFLRSGAANDLATVPHHDYFLMAGETKELRNVLGTELGLSGSGALLLATARSIFPNNPAGAVVSAWMRTSTPLLFGGDAGSSFAPPEPTDAARQVVAGLRHDGVGDKGFRGAVGVVNLHRTQGLTLRIEYLEGGGEVVEKREMHLPPLSTAQQVVPVRLSSGSARFVRIDGTGPYVAYATMVDNGGGEATLTYAGPEPGQPTPAHAISLGSLIE